MRRGCKNGNPLLTVDDLVRMTVLVALAKGFIENTLCPAKHAWRPRRTGPAPMLSKLEPLLDQKDDGLSRIR